LRRDISSKSTRSREALLVNWYDEIIINSLVSCKISRKASQFFVSQMGSMFKSASNVMTTFNDTRHELKISAPNYLVDSKSTKLVPTLLEVLTFAKVPVDEGANNVLCLV
jgi:hypothetical protein